MQFLSCPGTLYKFNALSQHSVMYQYIVHVQCTHTALCHVPVHCTCSVHSHCTLSCTSTLYMFSALTLHSVMSQYIVHVQCTHTSTVMSQYIVHVQCTHTALCHVPVHCTCSVHSHSTLSCPGTLYMFSALTQHSVMYRYIVHVQCTHTALCHVPVHCTCSVHSHYTLTTSQKLPCSSKRINIWQDIHNPSPNCR